MMNFWFEMVLLLGWIAVLPDRKETLESDIDLIMKK